MFDHPLCFAAKSLEYIESWWKKSNRKYIWGIVNRYPKSKITFKNRQNFKTL